MILILDTSSIDYIYLGLGNKSKIIDEKKIPAKFEQEEKLLISLKDFLIKKNIELKSLNGLIVVSGPGSFSALRIGLAVANTIAWSLCKPIVGFKKDKFKNYQELLIKGEKALVKIKKFKLIFPQYGKEPNISKAKK